MKPRTLHLKPGLPHAELVLSGPPVPRSSQAPAYLSQSLTDQISTQSPRSGTFSTQGSAPGLLSLSGTWASFLPCLPWALDTPPSLDFSCACPCAFFSMAHSSCPRVRTATATFSHPATRHSMPPSLLYFSSPQLTAAQASALVLQLSHFALQLPLPFTHHTTHSSHAHQHDTPHTSTVFFPPGEAVTSTRLFYIRTARRGHFCSK